jgi:hypothetical protein
MSLGGAIYLAIVVCAFLIFAGTLFWGMLQTSRVADGDLAYQGQKPQDRVHEGHAPPTD